MPPKKQLAARGRASTVKGDAFELRVVRYYEALGYSISRDHLILGHQVDIMARKYVGGIGHVSIMVEAKVRGKPLGVNDVRNFKGAAEDLLNARIINSAILITDAKITREAKLSFPTDIIRAVHIDALEKDLFNSSESLLRVSRDYQTNRIFQQYYPLAGRIETNEVDDISEHCLQWARTHSSMLVLVGDFGSGKTTIVDRAFYEAAQNKLKDDKAPFPVMLRLRSLRQHDGLWSFVEAALRDHQYITPPRTIWEAELTEGRLIVFLDGFDEIFTGATVEDRARYLAILSPIIRSPSACILTSRPTFFDSIAEVYKLARNHLDDQPTLKRLPKSGIDRAKLEEVLSGGTIAPLRQPSGANIVTISQLDPATILQAIKVQADEIRTLLNMTVDDFYGLLCEIYDLEDLMRRPLLLDMILKTTIKGAIDIRGTEKVGAATLYDIYTQMAAQRDEGKGELGQYLKLEQRLDACRAMAQRMKEKGEIVLSVDELATCVVGLIKPGSRNRQSGRIDIDGAITDIRTCSFVRFVDDGTISFTHRSFYEFFFAQSMMMTATDNPEQFFVMLNALNDREILYFLSSFVRDQDDFADFLRQKLRAGKTLGAGLQKLAFVSGVLLRHVNLIDTDIIGAELSKINVDQVHFNGVQLRRCAFTKVKGADWKLNNVTFDHGELRSVVLKKSTIVADCNGLAAEGLELSQSSLILSGRNVSIDMSSFVECKIRLRSNSSLGDVSFIRCSHVIVDGDVQLATRRVRFEKSSCYFQSADRWLADGSDLELIDCLIGSAVFATSDVVGASPFSRSRITLLSCHGMVFLRADETCSFQEAAEHLNARNPKLVVFDAFNLEPVKRSFEIKAQPRDLRSDEGLGKAGRKRRSKEAAKAAPFDAVAIALPEEVLNEIPSRFEILRAVREGSIDPTLVSEPLKLLMRLAAS
jgi:uncharacterized protein YjbI with pentapeptide repeats